MRKKGIQMSVELLIVVIICLVILAGSIAWFTSSSKKAKEFTDSCESLGGQCKACSGEDCSTACGDLGKSFGVCAADGNTQRTCCQKS